MEPVWMALGQAAGTAAHLARRLEVEPRDVPVSRLQAWLLENGQVITTFSDNQGGTKYPPASVWEAMQFFGTRGFFDSYEAKPSESVTRGTAAQWLMAAIRAGDFMPYYGPSVRHDGGGTADSSLQQLLSLGVIESLGDSTSVLTQGELTAWLSRVQPWIDGRWGDAWSKRTTARSDVPKPKPVDSPDKPVTRGEFCEQLFARFKSATPPGI
jgi:hypothetical protein